jgi:hypothetical protein
MNQTIYERKDYKIIQHLHYIMKNVDGLIWLLANQDKHFVATIDIIFRNSNERKLLDQGQVVIAIAETGLINTRKLYQFLGLKAHSKTDKNTKKTTHELVPTTDRDKRYPEDVDIKDLELGKITVADLDLVRHDGNPPTKTVVTHTLLAANKGVAHFTVDGVEGARTDYTLITAQVGLQLAEERVLGVYPMLDYRVWTNNPRPGSALPPRHRT